MEVIQLLEKCRKGHISVRKAFAQYGITNLKDGNVPLKEKSEQEVFAYLINWTMNEMKHKEKMFIRYQVGEETYQIELHYVGKHMRVNKPVVISTDKNFVLYEWEDTDTLNELTVQKVMDSMHRANARNYQRTNNEADDRKFWESWQTESPNPLTAEEYELVESFLDN